jgi:hypothetical protein
MTALPIRAATETLLAHGITPDRCVVLQNGHTLVLRLTETLVARVVQAQDGLRQGPQWFARETALAAHLTEHGAPVIPLHPALPPRPHEHLGYPMNFWTYVKPVAAPLQPERIGQALRHCHSVMRRFAEPLPHLGILTEALQVAQRALFPPEVVTLLTGLLEPCIQALRKYPAQPLHGDAHLGNVMSTTQGLLWTDWEDTFYGPVEWDVASAVWNAQLLEQDSATVDAITAGYLHDGAELDSEAMRLCMIARGAVMTAWYPLLYPEMDAQRQDKLKQRLSWLAEQPV